MGRRRAVVVGCLAVAIVVGALAYLRSDPTLDTAEEALAEACPEVMHHGHTLMVALVDEHDADSVACRQGFRRTAVAFGLPEGEVDEILGVEQGAVTANGLRLSTFTPRQSSLEGISFIELADCGRTVVPTHPDAWRAGVAWAGVWYSPCDDEFEIRVRAPGTSE